MKNNDTKIKKALEVLSLFDFKGEFIDIVPHGNGHINDTFLVCSKEDGLLKKYIFQRVNGNVFKSPENVMDNVLKVTEFIKNELVACGKDPYRGTLSVVKTKNGRGFYKDTEGSLWRSYLFIENTISLDLPETENDFYQSAYAFGNFQKMLQKFPCDELYDIIPNFHNTPARFDNFLKAIEENKSGRVANAQKEIEFILSRKEFMNLLEEAHKKGELPLKVTHNDTKLNNVMFDRDTREAVCVIDLDTVMPGYSVNDFGDSIRAGASTAAEDEQDLSKVHFDINMFEIYTKGFLKGCEGTLSDKEIELLPIGAMMMTIECGMRFLTDYLDGDTYFKTAYSDHNLVRCRTHIKLFSEMEQSLDKMKSIVEKYR